ncbi:Zonular occludens toxin [Undibacterium sp. CY18W]|uniref:Zonular occludens toxin n=1 Tax=Undibacterium hunanense TaxID=2762292 RepID=A0ABR6ZMK0_9BURK|nr:zonular occludens toxin domain-containing protein [Undibacterium hunanense]MBC3917106.1 Zonular occludens toxin [Undibacterium hunanense]
MITLITGLPGNGKTLYALSYVKAWAEKDNRPVYYSGVNDLVLPWQEIEPEKWFECPKNSIIVIDECQRVFRPRTIGKDVPEHVSKLETHRHQGVDIVLITQHPLLADSAIRRLVGKHMHVVRTFGTERATIHEWASAKDNCDKQTGRTDSIKHQWKYDKEAYSYYKSAETHTVKRNIPMRVYLLIALPILIIGAFLYMKNFTDKQKGAVQAEQIETGKKTQESNSPAGVSTGKGSKVSYRDAMEDAKQFAYENTPRVEGLPHTSPKYDEITTPTVAPVPAGCVTSKSRGCRCYTQQATPIEMPQATCEQIVKHGWFEDFDVAGKKKLDDDKDRNLQVADARVAGRLRPPDSLANEAPRQRVISFTDIKVQRQATTAVDAGSQKIGG